MISGSVIISLMSKSMWLQECRKSSSEQHIVSDHGAGKYSELELEICGLSGCWVWIEMKDTFRH